MLKNPAEVKIFHTKYLLVLAVVALSALILSITACISMSRKKFEGEHRMKIISSPNYRNGKFENLTGTELNLGRSFCSLMKEYLWGKQERVPKSPLPFVRLRSGSFTPVSRGLRVTWLGHSSAVIEIEGLLLILDPVFSTWASPLQGAGPRRFTKEIPLVPEDMPGVDAVIISHDHYDHLDYPTIKKIHHRAARFLVPLGVGAYLEKWGVPGEKISEFDWGEHLDIGGVRITAAPARHFSGRGPANRNQTLWASWIIKGKNFSVYYSGDSSYSPSFKDIGDSYGPFNVTLIETGQYSPYWPEVHMTPEESLQAHIDLRGDVMVPVHCGSFCISFHDWFEPVERLVRAADERKQTVATPVPGERITCGQDLPLKRWWREGRQSLTHKSVPDPEPAGM